MTTSPTSPQADPTQRARGVTRRGLGRLTAATALVGGAATLVGCSSADPLAGSGAVGGSDGPIVIGSQDYYSNEVIAECWAQALEAAGMQVDRQFRIGQREVYIPELTAGHIDLFPEYTGPLLQYWKKDAASRLPEPVYEELRTVVPRGLRLLRQSPATDQDSYVVSRAFAERWGITSIADLAKVTEPMKLGGNSEGENRPNGPKGLKRAYGVDVGFTPIEDGGGPLTVKALKDGSIQLAIIYSADPSIKANDLVTLTDPKGLFLASHVVPVASSRVDEHVAVVVDRVSAAMAPADLLAMNSRSVGEKLSASRIAKQWLAAKKLA